MQSTAYILRMYNDTSECIIKKTHKLKTISIFIVCLNVDASTSTAFHFNAREWKNVSIYTRIFAHFELIAKITNIAIGEFASFFFFTPKNAFSLTLHDIYQKWIHFRFGDFELRPPEHFTCSTFMSVTKPKPNQTAPFESPTNAFQ